MNITVKDIPTTLHRKLKTQAAADKRILNMEIIAVLESTRLDSPGGEIR